MLQPSFLLRKTATPVRHLPFHFHSQVFESAVAVYVPWSAYPRVTGDLPSSCEYGPVSFIALGDVTRHCTANRHAVGYPRGHSCVPIESEYERQQLLHPRILMVWSLLIWRDLAYGARRQTLFLCCTV